MTNGRGGPAEGFVEIDGEGFYVIPDVDRLRPFLMSVVSDTDLWMFVSSRGGLSAGRGTSGSALFPYETEDRLHRAGAITGPVTAIRPVGGEAAWHPMGRPSPTHGRRHLYKSVVGNQVIFEETNEPFRLAFRYRWANSSRFGFVRTSTIRNESASPQQVEVIDGLLDILPAGLEPMLYQRMSVLTHAYKRSEVLDPKTGLAVYSLEAGISDRAEPAESLQASVVWSTGFDGGEPNMDGTMVEAFLAGDALHPSPILTGRPGAYLLSGSIDLAPGEERSWMIVGDVDHDQTKVVALRNFLATSSDLRGEVNASTRSGSDRLVAMMATSDALQRTGDRMATAHHFANVTFNAMRGGVIGDDSTIPTSEFVEFLEIRNAAVSERHRQRFGEGDATVDRDILLREARDSGDPQLVRLALEYLPLTFSRRHGDPSRPWNEFSIRVEDDEGNPVMHYEGNWRDIFQNWEALGQSFPEYLPSMVAIFVNASTPDGFNPYRITRDGIDWEVPSPDEPWSNIGYWGDHQIVYLLRLVESVRRFAPGELERMLGEAWFSYADVPYRLVPYADMVADPKATIRFDTVAAQRTAQRTDRVGSDGKLLWDQADSVYLVTLLEKLVVPALSKLCNYVPGGGIWMNTQRPEWNDGNNALVGFGLSMVTLSHLRRYLSELGALIESSNLTDVPMSVEVAEWLQRVTGVFRDNAGIAGSDLDDVERRRLLDELGRSFGDYRSTVYGTGFSGTVSVPTALVSELCALATPHLDGTIRRNRRDDGLFHAYNLIRFSDGERSVGVDHLYEMLEGQVAVLSSGLLTPDEKADVLDSLFASRMYRADQNSFMLYPPRRPPSFIDKNTIAAGDVESNDLLRRLVDAGDRSVILVDEDDRYRFNSDLINGHELDEALEKLATDPRWSDLVDSQRAGVHAAYEETFNHRAFTGRSGTMYGYEGIGSIYWHMVAKLLVAAQEAVIEARANGASHETVSRLVAAYWRVRSGLGFNKTAVEYGAFPTDPYSHTPAHSGAQQPGMTGQVKEEILTRLLEVGVRVEDGDIVIDPVLLRGEELLTRTEEWPVVDLAGTPRIVEVPQRSLGMTFCQVPFVVTVTNETAAVSVSMSDGGVRSFDGLRIDAETSRLIFRRTGDVASVAVSMPQQALAL